MRWTGELTPTAARALAQRIGNRADNPARSERSKLGPGRHEPRRGLCPRLAVIRQSNGTVVIGIPDDGWCYTRVRAERPDERVYEDRARTQEVLR